MYNLSTIIIITVGKIMMMIIIIICIYIYIMIVHIQDTIIIAKSFPLISIHIPLIGC